MGTEKTTITEGATRQLLVRTVGKKETMAKTNLAVSKEINKMEEEKEVEVKEIMVVSKIQFLLMDCTQDLIKGSILVLEK